MISPQPVKLILPIAIWFALATAGIAYAEKPLPAWITKTINALRNSQSRDEIEEVIYKDSRAFEFVSGYRFDTGDEHSLFSEDGTKICQFGGFVGHVTAGSCDIDKIKYVRAIYTGKPH